MRPNIKHSSLEEQWRHAERARIVREDELAEIVGWAITVMIAGATAIVVYFLFFGWK